MKKMAWLVPKPGNKAMWPAQVKAGQTAAGKKVGGTPLAAPARSGTLPSTAVSLRFAASNPLLTQFPYPMSVQG
jgi:hypothetical protein